MENPAQGHSKKSRDVDREIFGRGEEKRIKKNVGMRKEREFGKEKSRKCSPAEVTRYKTKQKKGGENWWGSFRQRIRPKRGESESLGKISKFGAGRGGGSAGGGEQNPLGA